MERFLIKGGVKLKGAIKIRGAKNSSTKLMVASLLTDEGVLLSNFPSIIDTDLTGQLLREIGGRVDATGSGEVYLKTKKIENHRVTKLSRKNRIPILTLAPLIHRTGRAEVPFVGGDAIGARPVNFHLDILKKMGATIRIKKDSYVARARKLSGARITLPFPSVGATETGILAAVLAKGTTIIRNAAAEPEIIDLISLLQKMGALIELDTNRIITIEGVKHLGGAEHEIIPDRMEAASFGILALATDGNILVEDARQEHLITFLNSIRRVGGEYTVERAGIRFFRKEALHPLHIETSPHPGFMTDWQQPFAVLLMQARGRSTIHETVYEDRFGYVKDFALMGAKIRGLKKCLGHPCRFAKKNYLHSIEIQGPTVLEGSEFRVLDIRAGLAHLVAALAARGISRISGIEHIDRGYEKIDVRLRQVGARIERI